jgi:hypothetical protein
MAKVYLIKTLTGLAPDDEASEEILKKLKLGEAVSCDLKKSRNYKFHKKYFSMVNLALQNQDHFPETKIGRETFYDWLKLQAGYANYYTDPVTGMEMAQPQSISFAAMDETSFQVFYDDVKNVIFEKLIPAATPENIRDFEMELLSY